MMNEHMLLALHEERAARFMAEADAYRQGRQLRRARRARQSWSDAPAGGASARIPSQRSGSGASELPASSFRRAA